MGSRSRAESSMTTHATLPHSLEIDGTMHVECWRSRDLIILQNYDTPVTHDPDELALEATRNVGKNWFHLFKVIQCKPGEQLGIRLGTFNDVDAAITRASQITS
jgi:hypothetical protein